MAVFTLIHAEVPFMVIVQSNCIGCVRDAAAVKFPEYANQFRDREAAEVNVVNYADTPGDILVTKADKP